MKKLILIITMLLSTSVFAQDASDILLLLRGSDFEEAGGNLYAFGGVGLYESTGMALKINPPAPFTLTQTGAQVQADLSLMPYLPFHIIQNHRRRKDCHQLLQSLNL